MQTYTVEIEGHRLEVCRDADGKFIIPDHFRGTGTSLKPAFEPIVLARKPLSEGTVAANVLRWRTGALNIDACRIGTEIRHAAFTSLAPCHGNALGQAGTAEARRGTQGDPKEYVGRWPANVVHDGSDEVVGAFPSTAGQLAPISTKPGTKTNGIYGKMNREGEASADRRYTERGSTNFAAAPGQRREPVSSAARFFFNAKETDAQWLVRNLPSGRANDAPECFSLQSELAVSVLTHVVAQSMPQLALHCIVSPAPSMNVTPSELRRISETLIETIQSFERKCLPESLPAKLTLSDNLVSIAVACEQIDTITITISPSKSNGSVAPATFSITRQNSDRGAKGCAPSTARFHYSAKASKADRAGSKHPTVKPISLMQWIARLITPPGGTVLDPFAGSGTTGAACVAEGFRAVLCEREAEYVADIRRRLCGAAIGGETPYQKAVRMAAEIQFRVDSLQRCA